MLVQLWAASKTASLCTLQVTQRMSAVAEGAVAAPLYVYCGHDTTIMPILATLGIQLRDWPPYLSHVVSGSEPIMHRVLACHAVLPHFLAQAAQQLSILPP